MPSYCVLLAEDNPGDVHLIESAIDKYGLSINLHIVEDGEEACDFIARAEADSETSCPDLVILDLNLPRQNGKEVLTCLRQGKKCRSVPVLIISSSDLSRDREELSNLGANHYFRKPSTYAQFLRIGDVLKSMLQVTSPT